MFLGGTNGGNHCSNGNGNDNGNGNGNNTKVGNTKVGVAQPRPHLNRNRNRWRRNRKRSSTPTSLLLNGDNSDVDADVDCNGDGDGDDKNDYNHLEGDCDSLRACHQRGSISSQPISLPWSSDQHQQFVKAIFEIGIELSSPAVIAEQMITKNNYNSPDDPTEDEDDPLLPTSDKNHDSAACNGRTTTSNIQPRNTNIAVTTTATLASIGVNGKKHRHNPDEPFDRDHLPKVAAYYKRELTGERLKSHLQKLRKQRVREKDMFLKDYNRFLARKEVVDKEHKEVETRKGKRKEEARRRRLLKRKRSQKPSTLLEASASDHLDDFGRMIAVIGGCDNNDEDIHSNENVAKEEEERLLSMYLPLRSSCSTSNNSGRVAAHHDDFDSEHELFDDSHTPSAFPVGGRAIGRVTWAVMEQEIKDRKKRRLRQKQRQIQMQVALQHQQSPTPCPNGWETASVDSWTSHTAIAAGKVAIALEHGRHGPVASGSDRPSHHQEGEPETNNQIIVNCANIEDNCTDEENDDDDDFEGGDEFEEFKASVPTLTEAEKNSPLGVSLRLTWDMIKHMHGVIAEDRVSNLKEQKQHQQKLKA